MHFPRFWAKAEQDSFMAWGWSDLSETDARARAAQRASLLASRFGSKAEPPGIYPYGDRPLREPVLEERKGSKGNVIAAISRNAMGCEVLNTESLMFVDIDEAGGADSPLGPLFAWLAKVIFGVKEKSAAGPLAKVSGWCELDRSRGVRIYRTANGYRLIVTGKTFDPSGEETRSIFELFGSDPAYVRLCSRQKSFRARLTPKPWRCGMPSAPASWPFEDGDEEAAFRDWKIRYDEASQAYATCHFEKALGTSSLPRELGELVSLHDERTRATSGLPLA